jgi:hypothetical protein
MTWLQGAAIARFGLTKCSGEIYSSAGNPFRKMNKGDASITNGYLLLFLIHNRS